MINPIETEVLVVGAGPVGLTLAIDLAQRGVKVTVAEMRTAGEPPNGLSNVVSARSMEAIARSDAAAAGKYTFLVAKRSASGSSNNAQNGAFILRAGREEILTTLVLDRSAVGNYHAELSLQTDSGNATCTAP